MSKILDASPQTYRRWLIGHGALALLVGCILGFGFLFFLVGEIKLWPIPGKIELKMPGTYDAWRMAHLEGIINGLALWIVAVLLPLVPTTEKMHKRLALAFIITAWSFIIGATFDPFFADSRGLAFGGPITNLLAFFSFYPGVLAVIWASGYITYACLFQKNNTNQ